MKSRSLAILSIVAVVTVVAVVAVAAIPPCYWRTDSLVVLKVSVRAVR